MSQIKKSRWMAAAILAALSVAGCTATSADKQAKEDLRIKGLIEASHAWQSALRSDATLHRSDCKLTWFVDDERDGEIFVDIGEDITNPELSHFDRWYALKITKAGEVFRWDYEADAKGNEPWVLDR